MEKCGHLQVLCILLLAFHGVSSSVIARKHALSKLALPGETSNGDVFKSFWRNSKRRRSVTSMGTGPYRTSDQTPANKPQYECGDRFLTVVLKFVDAINIRIHGPHGDKLHLDHLAAFCGVSMKTTNTEVRLLFNYDSCYVKQEPSKRVLSLSWYGTDLDLTCPVSLTLPSMMCKNKAMELTVVDGTADELSVALSGEWAPLLFVATQCWHRQQSNQGVLTFSIPFTSCGVTVGEGNVVLDLRLKDKMLKMSCPYEQIPLLPVKDPGLSVTNQPLPQREPNMHHKPPTRLPTNAVASQVVKKEQFPIEQPARNAAKPPSLHHRGPLLPKLPSLPGSFNLAVNFPFALPMPTQHGHRNYLVNKPVALSPEPTSAQTPDPTDSSSEFSSSVQNQQPPVSEQKQEETAAPVTKTPKSEYHYLRYPNKFETSPQTKPSPSVQEYQLSRRLVSSASLYRPDGSAQNSPKPNPLQVNPAFANLAQYIPPGYFLCSYNNQQPPIHPHMFPPPDPNQPPPDLNQPLQYQKPNYPKPDVAQLAPVNPPVPPMKGYLQQPQLLAGAVAPSPYDSGNPLFQPTPNFQASPNQQQPLYPSGYGSQGSATLLSPASSLIPVYPQSQTRPYSAFQDPRPLQPQYYQKPSQPGGLVQQPLSTSPFLVKGLTQGSRPFMPAAPEYFQYQTGGGQSLDPYQRTVFSAPVTGISSPSQYMPSQPSTFPYSRQVNLFQPRSKSSMLFPRAPNTGDHPTSLPSPVHLPSQDKSEAQVAQLPHSQGPSVGYMQNPHVHPESLSEPRS